MFDFSKDVPSMNRRFFLMGSAAVLTSALSLPASTALAKKKRKAFRVASKYMPQRVRFSGYAPGTIVVDPRKRFLYLVETRSRARRYGIGVGRAGLAFSGSAKVGRKATRT